MGDIGSTFRPTSGTLALCQHESLVVMYTHAGSIDATTSLPKCVTRPAELVLVLVVQS